MSTDHPWHTISSGSDTPHIAIAISGSSKALKNKVFIKPHSPNKTIE
jgi:hypothetical protein